MANYRALLQAHWNAPKELLDLVPPADGIALEQLFQTRDSWRYRCRGIGGIFAIIGVVGMLVFAKDGFLVGWGVCFIVFGAVCALADVPSRAGVRLATRIFIVVICAQAVLPVLMFGGITLLFGATGVGLALIVGLGAPLVAAMVATIMAMRIEGKITSRLRHVEQDADGPTDPRRRGW